MGFYFPMNEPANNGNGRWHPHSQFHHDLQRLSTAASGSMKRKCMHRRGYLMGNVERGGYWRGRCLGVGNLERWCRTRVCASKAISSKKGGMRTNSRGGDGITAEGGDGEGCSVEAKGDMGNRASISPSSRSMGRLSWEALLQSIVTFIACLLAPHVIDKRPIHIRHSAPPPSFISSLQ